MYDTSVPEYVDAKRWEQAFITSPDPETCVPVALVGSDALKARADEQQQKIEEFKGWVQVSLRSIVIVGFVYVLTYAYPIEIKGAIKLPEEREHDYLSERGAASKQPS